MRGFIRLGCAVIFLGALFFMQKAAFCQTPFPEDSIVRQRCSACHKLDEQGRVEVIEETRKTPEEWKVVVTRMIRLNSAPLEDAVFDPVIKELSRYLCLSPQEMSQVAYLSSDENSQYRETPQNELEQRIYTACVRCHTFGKIASHRMTPSQWAENRNLHLGYYPTTIPQMREMDWAKESQELVEPLAKRFAFDDPDWKAWMQSRKDQDLSGQWKVAGYQPGLGYYTGSYVFKPNSQKGQDEYLIEKVVQYENGTSLKMSGDATLYGTYHLRYALAPTPLTGRIEGVFDLDAADMGFSGKWWTVIQDTNAYGNEKFVKVGGEPKIIAVFPQALKAGGKAEQKITLIAVNFADKPAAADFKFSETGITVKAVESMDHHIVCSVQVSPEAAKGVVKLTVKGVAYAEPLTVFDKIDGIKILPSLGRARVSCGAAYPPHGVQYVARAINFGPDGKPDTADDLMLEPVDATWWLEEEKTRENDDDLKYLQAPVLNGLYTPVTTYGPIEARHQRREGVGLVGIGAAYSADGQEFKARALLAVTDPDFVTHIK